MRAGRRSKAGTFASYFLLAAAFLAVLFLRAGAFLAAVFFRAGAFLAPDFLRAGAFLAAVFFDDALRAVDFFEADFFAALATVVLLSMESRESTHTDIVIRLTS